MKRPRFDFRWVVTLCLLLWPAAAVTARVPDAQLEKRAVLTRARENYYNLRRLGLIEFRSKIQPKWEMLLEGVDKKEKAINFLSGLHFSVSVDPNSRFRLEYQVDKPPQDQKEQDGYNRIIRGMDGAVKNFFGVWSIFMLTSPFPALESECQVNETPTQYLFSHKEGNLEVVTTTDKDFMVIEISVTAPGYNASLKPVFEKTSKGFILKGYVSRAQTGPRVTSLKTILEYEELNGVQMLHKVSVDALYDGIPAQMEWLFTDYQIKVR